MSLRTNGPDRKRGWPWWLIPRSCDLVSSLLYLGVLGAFLYNLAQRNSYQSRWWEILLMVSSIIVLLTVDRLEYGLFGEEAPARVTVSLLFTRMIFIEAVAWLDHFDLSPFLYLVVPYLAWMSFGNRVGYWFAGLAWGAYVVEHLLIDPDWLTHPEEVHYLGIFSLGLIFVMTMAHMVMKEKASRTRAEQLFGALENSHHQLKRYAEQVAELATAKERNRLARDIHDSLGHYLTVINVQLEMALAIRGKSPREADQAISNAKRLASDALQDVRRSVGTLRSGQEGFSCASAVTALVEHVRTSQFDADLHITGSEAGFSQQGLIALYRAAQEGLTNVQKHAGTAHARVELVFETHSARLCMSDNGCGFEQTHHQDTRSERTKSYGLQGLQERLELVGGLLQIKSSPGAGTTLVVTVPKDPLAHHLPARIQAQRG